MTYTQIYINDVLLDLDPSTAVAKSLQCFDLFDLGAIVANYSNQIKVPFTPNNDKAFSFLRDLHSNTAIPYTNVVAKVIQDGVQLFTNGVAVISQTDSEYNLTILDGNYNFFQQIVGKSLVDISALSTYVTDWNDAAQFAKRANTTGIIPALIDYGNLTSSAGSIVIDCTKNMPCIYLPDLVVAIFKTFGFTVTGSILTDPNFTNIVIPLGPNYSDAFCANKNVVATSPGQVIPNPVSAQIVIFNANITQGSDLPFNSLTSKYTAAAITGLTAADQYYMCRFYGSINVTAVTGGGIAALHQVANGTDTIIASISSAGTFGWDTTIGVSSNQSTWYYIQTSTGTANVTIGSAIFNATVPTISPGQNFPAGGTGSVGIVPQFLMPDMLITDFITDLSLLFGLQFNQKGNVVQIKGITELINGKTTSVDWTNKRDTLTQEKTIYQFGSYSAINNVQWANDADSNCPDTLGIGTFTIANINLTGSNDINTKFSSSLTELFLNVNTLLNMKIYDNVALKYTEPLGLRIAMVRPKLSSESNAVFGASGTSTTHMIAYFLDSSQANGDLSFANLLLKYYGPFITALQFAKMVTRNYLLTPFDMASFDPFKLIYDDGINYIVNSISNFVTGTSTQVELFKL